VRKDADRSKAWAKANCKDDFSNDPRRLIALIEAKACELLHSRQDYSPLIELITDIAGCAHRQWPGRRAIKCRGELAPLQLSHRFRSERRRRQRHTATSVNTIASARTIALLQNRPPGRSMVRDHSMVVAAARRATAANAEIIRRFMGTSVPQPKDSSAEPAGRFNGGARKDADSIKILGQANKKITPTSLRMTHAG